MLEEKMNTNSPLLFGTASLIFHPWENNVRKEMSKLRSVAEFKAFNGNTQLDLQTIFMWYRTYWYMIFPGFCMDPVFLAVMYLLVQSHIANFNSSFV
jgi:hypothetical protein